MRLLIKFPTRGRWKVFKQTFEQYRDMLSGRHEVQFVISMDLDDLDMNKPEVHAYLDSQKNVCYCYGPNRSKVQAINANMEGHDYDVLLLASDDMVVQIEGYDDVICSEMEKHFPELDGCLHFNDGRVGAALNTLSIMGKKLYDHLGGIYHSDYISLWADNEFDLVTKQMGKSVYIDQVIIAHKWVDVTGQDSLHKHNESFNGRDKRIFERRKAKGFPRESVGADRSRDRDVRRRGYSSRRRRP